jgi:threonine dehydratase
MAAPFWLIHDKPVAIGYNSPVPPIAEPAWGKNRFERGTSMVSLVDIWCAKQRIAGRVHRTPMVLSASLSQLVGSEVNLKAEHLQKTGSFKVRGAFNRILSLPAEAKSRGVVAFSSGNHAQAVAYAARELGIPATVVMPPWGNPAKLAATRGYGAEVVLYGQTSLEMAARAREPQEERGLAFIHPFDEPTTIAGQGTLGLEILEDCPDADCIFVPIGGGGLIAGIAAAVKSLCPSARMIGVQPEHSCSMYLSRQAGQITEIERCETAADGLVAKKPGVLTFQMAEAYVDEIITVTEKGIEDSQVYLMQRTKMLVELSGAVGLAGLLSGSVRPGRRNVVLLSGGNCNLGLLGQALVSRFS